MAKRKRLDGIGYLTKEQKAERDARAQYWMNQRKIERVAQAAARHGFYEFSPELVIKVVSEKMYRRDESKGLIVMLPEDGEYVFWSHNQHEETWTMRKILTYPKESSGSN